MRQYQIFYKRLGSEKFAPLIPNVHANLYGRQEIKEAILIMRDHPHIEGLAIRLDDAQFNVIVTDQEELESNAIQMPAKLEIA